MEPPEDLAKAIRDVKWHPEPAGREVAGEAREALDQLDSQEPG